MKLIDKFLQRMVELGSSDLHIYHNKKPVIRLPDGNLFPIRDKAISKVEIDEILKEIVNDVANHTKWLKREEIDTSYENSLGRYRACIGIAQAQPFVILRELKNKVPSIYELGIPKEFINAVMGANYGIVLVVGTTGSGKTTTLASMSNHILANKKVSLVSIEDPVEYIIGTPEDAVLQRRVGMDTKAFESGLISALRMDADYIVIGEMRDLETARHTLIGAETGHVVLVTLHGKTCTSVIDRFCTVFPTEEQNFARRKLTENIIAVMTQYLIYCSDSKRRLACELLLPDDRVKELLFKQEYLEVRRLMDTDRRYGWTLPYELNRFLQQGLITKDVLYSYIQTI